MLTSPSRIAHRLDVLDRLNEAREGQIEVLRKLVDSQAVLIERQSREIWALTSALLGLGIFLVSSKIARPEIATLVRDAAADALEPESQLSAKRIIDALDLWVRHSPVPD
jgi:hypothetical protein